MTKTVLISAIKFCRLSFYSIALLLFLFLESCADEESDTLWLSQSEINIPASGGTSTITIKTDAADGWRISNPSTDWVNLSKTSGTLESETVDISVSSKSLEKRETKLTLSAGNADPLEIKVVQAASDYLYDLSANINYAEFSFSADEITIEISSETSEWNLSCDAEWLQISKTTGAEGTFSVVLSTEANEVLSERTTTITLSGDKAPTSEIAVLQKGGYPNYNINPLEPDMTGMNSSAQEIAAQIKIGWNIGNTLEAIGGETAWGNPKVTESLIQLVKENGFNAIRIPCSWDQNMENSTTAKIKSSWLDRVKEVVQYCVDNDMYAILNIHWDGGWLENNCTPEKQDENNAKQKAFWEQIATHLRDFDEHLLFAGANEPNVDDETQMNVLLSYHQTFVDAVRSTGGKNSYRTLVVQGPSTDIEKTNNLMSTLPNDEVEGRMMAEIHYYTPYQFCLMTEDASWGKMFYYWGKDYHSTTDTERNASWGEESTLDDLMGRMKTQFVDKGIPVVLGEFAAIKRTSLTGDKLQLHLNSRAHFLKYLAKQARANGLLPFYWDAGNMGENASALFNRQNNTVFDQQALDALMEGVNESYNQ
ncbi:cellulase family glycosylhydrolase [Maribellus mangrovi]|uniref:cellulase family glycosylhydrolase n=1 Tax=Maribellus mangrovi TaxID=3133146 RepID=UPI0030EEF9D0